MPAKFLPSQPPVARSTSGYSRSTAGVRRSRARAWALAAVGCALLAAGCQPTKGNDNAFEAATTTNTDFTAAEVYAVGFQPNSVAVAPSSACPFPNNNAPNVAVANYAGDSISYLTNRGDGTFIVSTLPTPTAPTKVLFADLDHTGVCTPDLVVMHTSNTSDPTGTGFAISVMLTADNAHFSTTTIGLITVPEQIAVADMNHDGWPDIVVSLPALNEMAVFLNLGGGTFATVPISTILLAQPSRFIVTNYAGVPLDFDGDGCTDLVVVTPALNQIQVLTSNNGGACAPTTTNGSTGYAVAPYVVDVNPFTVAAADLDGDGLPELIVPCTNASLLDILHNQGGSPATFATFSGTPLPDVLGSQRMLVDAFAGPVTPSNPPTFAVVHPVAGAVSHFKYSGGVGGFFTGSSYALDSTPFDLVSGVFTLSGNRDLAVPEQKRRILYIGHGDGTGHFLFSQIGFLSTPGSPVVRRLRPGTAQDIVLPQPLDSSVVILRNVHP